MKKIIFPKKNKIKSKIIVIKYLNGIVIRHLIRNLRITKPLLTIKLIITTSLKCLKPQLLVTNVNVCSLLKFTLKQFVSLKLIIIFIISSVLAFTLVTLISLSKLSLVVSVALISNFYLLSQCTFLNLNK